MTLRITFSKLAHQALVASAIVGSGPVIAQNGPIRIGVLATLDGPLAVTGQDAIRGTEMAIAEFPNGIGGRKIEMVKESSNGKPDLALTKARKLIEQDKVDLFVGPLSGSEGLAIKEYAKTLPNVTFVNGTSAAQELTLREPASNFFRFTGDGAQWQAGLGAYAYEVKGYRNVALIAEDYSFPYSQVAGFVTEFCGRGGKMPARYWIPLGSKDYSSVIAKLPTDIDALYVILAASDAVNFFSQYYQSGGKAALIAGTPTIDRTVLSSRGSFKKGLVGAITAGPMSEDDQSPAWKNFVTSYQKLHPNALGMPSFGALTYYTNTKALLTGLQQVNGDLSDGQKKLQKALASLKLDSPTGTVTLDHNRQAVTNNFVSVLEQRPDGSQYLKVVRRVQNVNQTLGQTPEAFLAKGISNRDNPPCTN